MHEATQPVLQKCLTPMLHYVAFLLQGGPEKGVDLSPEIILDPYAELFSQTCGMVRSSAVRDLMSITGRSDVISFAGGLPYIGGLSADEIAPVIADIVEQGYEEALQYGETEGRDSLKEQLAALMAEEGNPGEPEHMMVTTGSQQALDLLGRALIDAGDAIIVEGPTYIGALSAFCPCGPRIITVPVDDMGIRTDLLARELDGLAPERPKFIYVVPNFQNPAGVTTAERRREELLALAAERDILVIEDTGW